MRAADDPPAGPQAARSKRLERQSAPRYFEPPPPPAVPATVTSNFSSVNTGVSAGATGANADATAAALGRLQCAPTAACHLQLAQLRDEKAFLAKYVERLLDQLRALLLKHGELEKLKAMTDPLAESESPPGEGGHHLAPWLLSQEYTNPLLQAYDAKIYELVRLLRACEGIQCVWRLTVVMYTSDRSGRWTRIRKPSTASWRAPRGSRERTLL